MRFKKLLPAATVPAKAHNTDAGFDLTATSINVTDNYVEYGTSIAVEVPAGWVGLLFPRSSVSNRPLSLSNSVGVIDHGYQGEILFRFRLLPNGRLQNAYGIGEKIGQLVLVPCYTGAITQVDDFNETTERGENGFGSSDR